MGRWTNDVQWDPEMLKKLRFMTRDLFWMTIVAALSVGWWIHQNQLQGTIESLNTTNAKLETDVDFWRGMAQLSESLREKENGFSISGSE